MTRQPKHPTYSDAVYPLPEETIKALKDNGQFKTLGKTPVYREGCALSLLCAAVLACLIWQAVKSASVPVLTHRTETANHGGYK